MSGHAKRRSDGGFTLIEMMITIVVIGILLGMFAAITSSVQASARIRQTRVVLKALQMALDEYQTQTGRLPAYTNAAGVPFAVLDVSLGLVNTSNAVNQGNPSVLLMMSNIAGSYKIMSSLPPSLIKATGTSVTTVNGDIAITTVYDGFGNSNIAFFPAQTSTSISPTYGGIAVKAPYFVSAGRGGTISTTNANAANDDNIFSYDP